MDVSQSWLTPGILESISDGFVYLDHAGHYVFVNQAAEHLLDKKREELVGRHIWDVFPLSRESPFRQVIDRALETGETTQAEGFSMHRGAWFDVQSFRSPHGLIILFRDVTEQRLNTEQTTLLAEAGILLSSSLDYEQTLEHVANMMVPRLADWCAVDVFDEAGRLERVTVAHVDPEKIRWAREVTRRFPSDPERPGSIAHVARTGKPLMVPLVTDEILRASAPNEEHLKLARQIGFKSVITVPLLARDRSLGAIMMVWAESGNQYSERDLRFAQELARRAAIAVDNARLYKEARDAEASLRQLNETLEARVRERTQELQAEVREKTATQRSLARVVKQLENRNRDLQDFATVASHDLQEPLRKVSSFAELLQQEHAGVLDEAGLSYLERIRNAAGRMQDLIRDLLDYSRVATGEQRLERVDLNGIVAGVLSDLEVRMREENGQVHIGRLPTIEADAMQMRQLFQNLIGNSLKFHLPGVPPVVNITGTVESVGDDRRPVCCLEVSDNGIGFKQANPDEIFLPFKRLHGRGEYVGTGIGLAICRRIVERHGGTISAESRPGSGSTFRVVLPVSGAISTAAA